MQRFESKPILCDGTVRFVVRAHTTNVTSASRYLLEIQEIEKDLPGPARSVTQRSTHVPVGHVCTWHARAPHRQAVEGSTRVTALQPPSSIPLRPVSLSSRRQAPPRQTSTSSVDGQVVSRRPSCVKSSQVRSKSSRVQSRQACDGLRLHVSTCTEHRAPRPGPMCQSARKPISTQVGTCTCTCTCK